MYKAIKKTALTSLTTLIVLTLSAGLSTTASAENAPQVHGGAQVQSKQTREANIQNLEFNDNRRRSRSLSRSNSPQFIDTAPDAADDKNAGSQLAENNLVGQGPSLGATTGDVAINGSGLGFTGIQRGPIYDGKRAFYHRGFKSPGFHKRSHYNSRYHVDGFGHNSYYRRGFNSRGFSGSHRLGKFRRSGFGHKRSSTYKRRF